MTPSGSSGWSFVGREGELARSRALLQAGTGTLVVGGPGIGKSSFATQLVASMPGPVDSALVVGRAVSSGTPYEAFATLLDGSAGGDTPPLGASDVAARLVAASGDHGLLVVDDIDLLDEHSARVVLFLATSGARTVVATARGPHLPDVVAALWRGGLCERVDLTGLSEEEVASLLETALGAPPGVRVAETFWHRTQGNPLLLRELIETALTRSILVRRDAVWVLVGDPPVSGGVRDLVAERLADLDDEARAGLEAIAAGEPLPAQIAIDAVGEALLSRLDEDGLLSVTVGLAGPEVGTAHPLYGEVLRADIPALRMRRLRLQLAAALEGAPDPSPHDLVRAATWRLDSGQADDPERLMATAQAARAVSLDVAERLARRAHDTQRSMPATMLLAEILTHAGRQSEAAALLAGLPPESLSVQQREALTYISAVGQGLMSGDPGAGARLVEALTAGDPSAGSYVQAAHASLLAFDARLEQALEQGRPIMLDPRAAPETRTLAAIGALGAAGWLGRNRQALEDSDVIRAVALEPSARQVIPFGYASVELLAISALLDAGDLDAAQARAEALRLASKTSGDPFGAFRAEYCLARVAIARGLATTAVRHQRRCIAAITPFDQYITRHLQAVLARALVEAGDPAAARVALAAGAEHPGIKPYEMDWDLAWAAVLAAELRLEEAADQAAWGGSVAADNHLWTAASIAYHDAARYGAAGTVLSVLREVSQHVDGELVRVYVDHAAALAGRDAQALDQVATRFHDLGFVLLAAEASAEAALRHQADGHPRPARASGDRSQHWLQACEAPLGAWLAGGPAAAPLTARERQIASLAATGYSDLDIGRRLNISTRTVQTHLAHVYAKIGINRRGQLREQLGL